MALPSAIDIRTAARVLGISAGKAYELAKAGEFPVKTLRLGRLWRVPTAELIRYLGLEPGRSPDAAVSAEDEKHRRALAHARTQRDKWAAEADRLERETGAAPAAPTNSGPTTRALLVGRTLT